MTITQSKNREANEFSIGWQPYLLGFVAVVTAALIIIPLLPGLISNLVYSFSGPAPKIYWYLSRSAGFVALTILWVAMALGLSITNKMARLWPGAPTAFAIHEYVSLLGLAFVIYHGLVLMGDHFVDFSLPRLLTPFSIEYETIWVGLGQISFYAWLIAALSFYIRRWIGQKTWRLIHYINFAAYIMGWLHGTFSGTDSSIPWVEWYYWLSGASLMVLLAHRVYESSLKKKVSLSTIRQQIQSLSEAAWPSKAEIPQPRIPEVQAPRKQAPRPTNSSSSSSAPSSPEGNTTGSGLVEKYEMGTGKDRINVRIFKEPPAEAEGNKPETETNIRPVDPQALVLKLKEELTATPIQPPQVQDAEEMEKTSEK